MNEKTLFVTEIHGDDELSFRVRTYERDSSAMVHPPSRFRVTTVHWINPDRGLEFVDEIGRDELTHWEVCAQLIENGELNYEGQ